MTYTAQPCPCGDNRCEDWHVEPVAAYQGVSFTQKQAEAVARLLNSMEQETNRVMQVTVLDDQSQPTDEVYWLDGTDMEEATETFGSNISILFHIAVEVAQ